MLAAIATGEGAVPAAEEFKGGSLVSAPGLIKWLDKRPSVVTIAGEMGYLLQRLNSARANPNDLLLKATLLDLYGKSGDGGVFDPLAYSDRDKQTSPIIRPALTLLGESVPSVVYEALSDQMVLSGLLPRFLIVEVKGDRSPLNESPATAPDPALRQRMADLCGYALGLNNNNQVVRVPANDAATQMLREFGQWVTDEINAHTAEVTKELWNRAYLKALKLATLRAVCQNYLNPVVSIDNAVWATNLVAAQTKAIIGKFETGDVGEIAGNQTLQERQLLQVVAEYMFKPFDVRQTQRINKMATAPNTELAPVLNVGSDGLVHISLGLNPGYYEENPGESQAIKAAHIEAKAMRNDFTNHHERRITRNPKVTEAQHAEDVKKDLQGLDDKTMQRIRSQSAKFEAEISATLSKLDADANLVLDKDFVNAVTGAFYGLSPSQKMAEVAKMIEHGDSVSLAILIKSPNLITGLDNEQRDSIRRRAHEKANPTGLRNLDLLKAAGERWHQGAHGAVRTLMDCGQGLNRFDAEIARAEAVAQKAPGAGFHG